uniref:Uncharacterized protein n=1 Tax=Onchocerca volvulus TaxID=6282 RepID=A0A8R1TR15_ONCVO
MWVELIELVYNCNSDSLLQNYTTEVIRNLSDDRQMTRTSDISERAKYIIAIMADRFCAEEQITKEVNTLQCIITFRYHKL